MQFLKILFWCLLAFLAAAILAAARMATARPFPIASLSPPRLVMNRRRESGRRGADPALSRADLALLCRDSRLIRGEEAGLWTSQTSRRTGAARVFLIRATPPCLLPRSFPTAA